MIFNEQDYNRIVNATVYDRDGTKVGNVKQVYYNEDTNQPSWIVVSVGFFGKAESFVPLDDAT